MKFPFFKSLLLTGALLLAWNCTDSTSVPMGALSGLSEQVWVVDIGPNENLYIAEDGTVYDSQWKVFGSYSDGNIVTTSGETFLTGVDTADRPKVEIVETNGGTKMVKYDNGSVTDIEGNDIGTVDQGGNIVNNNGEIIAENPDAPAVTSSASGTNPTSAGTNPGTNPASSNSSGTHNTPTSSAASQQGGQCGDNQCYDGPSGKCVDHYAEQTGSKGEKYAYDKTCSVNCYYDPANNGCKSIQSASSTPKSSASQNPGQSSSSKNNQTQSSSSRAQSQGPSLLPKVIGQEKDGYATRYWDSCKPHCAWEGKGGPVARTCHADGSKAGTGEASACDGGPAGTCTDQTPQIVNDTIAYAFAATPGGGNDCGKCYMLTFKGTGASATNTPTDDAHRSIKGKHLIVMASNIGYDVSHNQFDLMIPGGGNGAFNGCSKMGLSCAGASHGGFLTTCNYSKSCLINMCNKEYANNTNMRNGCLFLANWMNAANNPEVKFVQVECPSALTAKY